MPKNKPNKKTAPLSRAQKDQRNRLLEAMGVSSSDIYNLEAREYTKETGYLPTKVIDSVTESNIDNNKSETSQYSRSINTVVPPSTRSMGISSELYSVIKNKQVGADDAISSVKFSNEDESVKQEVISTLGKHGIQMLSNYWLGKKKK